MLGASVRSAREDLVCCASSTVSSGNTKVLFLHNECQITELACQRRFENLEILLL